MTFPFLSSDLQVQCDPLPSDKLTWQWKMYPLNMYFLLKMGIIHCYVSLPEGSELIRQQKSKSDTF